MFYIIKTYSNIIPPFLSFSSFYKKYIWYMNIYSMIYIIYIWNLNIDI